MDPDIFIELVRLANIVLNPKTPNRVATEAKRDLKELMDKHNEAHSSYVQMWVSSGLR